MIIHLARARDADFVDSWGEPERAPHRRVECSQSIYVYMYILYIIMYGTSVTRAPLYKLYSNSRYIAEAA